MQKKTGAGMTLQGLGDAANRHGRAMIPAHNINRYDETLCQESPADDQPHGRSLCARIRLDNLAPLIVSAGPANMMRALELAAIRALDMGVGGKAMVGAAHIAL
jgi:hypothetical protein